MTEMEFMARLGLALLPGAIIGLERKSLVRTTRPLAKEIRDGVQAVG